MDDDQIHVTLALETAVRGGSISVLRNGVELAATSGETGISRAEDLISSVDHVLRVAAISSKSIDIVAVSNGPGSYTGIRIGISTAMGLAEAFGAEIKGVNLLDAMGVEVPANSRALTAIPIGRDDVAWLEFSTRRTDNDDPVHCVGTFSEFVSMLHYTDCTTSILHPYLIEILNQTQTDLPERIVILDSGDNLANYVGRAVNKGLGTSLPTPIYLSNQARSRGLL